MYENLNKKEKAHEKNMFESEEGWRFVAQNIPVIIMSVSREGKILSLNHTVTGRRIEDAVGKSIYDYSFHEHSEIMKKTIEKVFVTGKPDRYEIKGDGPKGPNTSWYETRVIPLKRDNKIIAVTLISIDITESKRAAEKILENEEKLSTLFETAADGIAYVDKTGKIIEINKRMEDMLGYKRGEIIGKNFSDIKIANKKEMKKLLKQTSIIIVTGKTIENFETKILRKDGRTIHVEISSGIIRKEGKLSAFSLIIRDITGKKEMEEDVKESRDALAKAYDKLKLLEKIKDDFLNISAHELKTPLVPIISYIDLMIKDKKSKLGKKEKEKLKICLRNAVRLKNLVTDISDISKLSSKSMKFDIKSVKIDEIISMVIQDLRPAVKIKNLEIGGEVKPKLPLVSGDPERIAQAISKLVENSIKFTDKGRITVSAKKQKDSVIISVTDTGIGIDKKDIPKLFMKFFQADTSITRKIKGTGLGLVICKEIIEAQKGKIWVESPGVGKGTTVYFTLPLAKK